MSGARYPATPDISRINVAPSPVSFNISVKDFLEKASDHFTSLAGDSGLIQVPPSHTFYCGMVDRERSMINGHGTAIIAPDKILQGVFDSSINFAKQCKLTDEETTTIVSGDYENGQFNGLGGITTPEIAYEGMLVAGEVAGSGKMNTPEFSYSGEFADNGKRHGLGELIVGRCKYVGGFRMDLPHGKVKLYTDDPATGLTTKFEGDFVMGKQHGEGRLIDSEGTEWFVVYENDELRDKQPYHMKLIRDLREEIDTLRSQCENSCDITCKVCMAAKSCVLTMPCGHLALCEGCETRLSRDGSKRCPICRAPYRTTAKVIIPT